MKSFFVLFEPEKRSRFRPQNVQGLNLGFGHERGLAADLVTIDSNEMFGNEAIHQGVDTLATCVQRAPKDGHFVLSLVLSCECAVFVLCFMLCVVRRVSSLVCCVACVVSCG